MSEKEQAKIICPQGNYVLLYSMEGYALRGTKRALLRRLTQENADAPVGWTLFQLGGESRLADAQTKAASLKSADYISWVKENKTMEIRGVPAEEPFTFCVYTESCDFTDVSAPGTYVLCVEWPGGEFLCSRPFLITERPLTQVLKALTVENAHARYANDTEKGGFYDCNNPFGEAYSHGTFLYGLCNYAQQRGTLLSADERRDVLWAAQVAFDYLMTLMDTETGEICYCAGERPGDAEHNSGIHNSMEALEGLAAFMDTFHNDDPARANRENLDKLCRTMNYIDGRLKNDGFYKGEWKLTVLCRLYRAFGEAWMLDEARELGKKVIALPTHPLGGGGCVTSFIEGLWLLGKIDPEFTRTLEFKQRMDSWKQDASWIVENSAYHFPQIAGKLEALKSEYLGMMVRAWQIYWTLNQGIEGIGLDACFLWELTGDPAFEKIAAGALHYITGVNFGIPQGLATEKTDVGPLTCASFIGNAYGGIIPWLDWGFEMKNTTWASIVNGYKLENRPVASVMNGYPTGRCDYVYTHLHWQTGETFIRMDGVMAYAGALYERLVNQE